MPLVLLLDTSASASPYINELNACLNRFKTSVCQDRQTQDILDVAVMQFGSNLAVLQDFAPVTHMRPVRLITGGSAYYSAPIQEALRMVDEHVKYQSGTYKPWIIFITGSSPVDDISAVAREVQNMQSAEKLRFMVLGVQGYVLAALKQLTDVVFRIDGTDFAPFFDWISKCMWAIAQSAPRDKPQLPPLQGNVYRDK